MISENWKRDGQSWASFWPKAGHCWTGPMAKMAEPVQADEAAHVWPLAVTMPGANAVARSVRPCWRLLDGDINFVTTFDGWDNHWATRGRGSPWRANIGEVDTVLRSGGVHCRGATDGGRQRRKGAPVGR
jgi:hypothetical protein